MHRGDSNNHTFSWYGVKPLDAHIIEFAIAMRLLIRKDYFTIGF